MNNRRPNILFLMSDEHRHDVTGFSGNSVVRTPHLDTLAATGVVFNNAYAPSPICVPGRQSIMSGQYPNSFQCPEHGFELPPQYMTYARRFAQYSYGTVNAGKIRHRGEDKTQGWDTLIGWNDMGAPIASDEKNPAAYAEYEQRKQPQKWSSIKEVKRAGIGQPPQAIHDAYTVDGAKYFINEWFNSPYFDRQQADFRPLLLRVSLLQPHYPFLTDEAKFNYYLNRVKLYENNALSEHPFLGGETMAVKIGTDVSEREAIRATAAYYGMVESVDQQIGRILAALETVGQDLNEWIIVYTSDHGEMLGEHGVWEKQKFYEGSAKVPLIINYGKKLNAGLTVDENVSLCDLFATLCDLANVPTPTALDSRSLVPLMNGENASWNNEVLSEFRDFLMIKQDNLKYQSYGSDIAEVLFDLTTDPKENVNVLTKPEYKNKVDYFRTKARKLGFAIP